MDTETIARHVAKWLVQSLIAAKTAEITADAADNYTRFEKDSLTVKLGAGAVGMIVSKKLEPVTDKLVDKTADFLVKKRADFRAKKNAKQQEK